MKRCILCGRKISNEKYNFGLGCLKKSCQCVGITNAKNLKFENNLNNKICKLNGKVLLNKQQKQLLTDRYLTYHMLEQVDIPHYKKITSLVGKDIKNINYRTKKVKSSNIITLKDASEILKLYMRYKKLLEQTQEYSKEELKNELQNLPWDTLMFAFSTHYEKKPYLSELIQVVQLFAWKMCAKGAELLLDWKVGAKFLNHSLQANPKDIDITKGIVVERIKQDINFKKAISKVLSNNKNKEDFLENQIGILFDKFDLKLGLNNVIMSMSGKKEKDHWALNITMTDRFDFTDLKELTEYIKDDIIKSAFLSTMNNLGMLSTAYNVINEYNITIQFSMEEAI